MAKTIAYCALVFAAFVAFAAAPQPVKAANQPGSDERRIALVIGNNAYPEAPLRNSINDARAMAARLRALGFDVIALENGTQARMNKAITDFSERLTEKGAGLFYFAGHGMQARGRNFLIPVDADITSEVSVRNQAIDVDQILDALGDVGKRTNIIILDACRNNPFGRFRGGGTGLAQVAAPAGTLIAYATAPGMTAADGQGANGVYTAQILTAIDVPGLRVEDVFKRVRVAVARATGNAQVPWEASSLIGDFYFVAPSASDRGGTDKELIFWNTIKDSKDKAAFEAYLRQYPKGAFAELARYKLAALQPAPAPAPPSAAPAASPSPVVPSKPATTSNQAAAIRPPAQPQQPRGKFDCPKTGTVVETSLNTKLTFTGEDGLRCRFTDQAGRSGERYAIFFSAGSDFVKFGGEKIAQLWPLSVGKEIVFVANGTQGSWYHTYAVKRRESVTVKAGTFDAFVIEHREQGTGGNSVDSIETYWFAPAVGYFVKFAFEVRSGSYKPRPDWEATRVALP